VRGGPERASCLRGRAAFDPALSATVVARRPLRYDAGADRVAGRPAHVRAGSALVEAAGRLVVVQDDASFVALIGENGVQALEVPYAPGGARIFEARLGNKPLKLDLEAAITLPDGRVLALGSGSRPVREHVVLLDVAAGRARVLPLPALYAALRARSDFAGAELNVEGAALLPAAGSPPTAPASPAAGSLPDAGSPPAATLPPGATRPPIVAPSATGARVRLFNRGNGAATDALPAVDATADVALADLHALLDGSDAPPPRLHDVARYDLGEVDGTRLTFTDAAVARGALFALACAERSPNAYDDGPVTGVALGVFEGLQPGAALRMALLRDAAGAPFLGKAEGLWLDPADPSRALVVLDLDDPDAPAELCEVRLAGPW
jgi:hypothetical protein